MNTNYSMDQSAVYEIRVRGQLSDGWKIFFENLDIRVENCMGGEQLTVLTGRLVDQAALQGTLQKLYTLGFPLISLKSLAA